VEWASETVFLYIYSPSGVIQRNSKVALLVEFRCEALLQLRFMNLERS